MYGASLSVLWLMGKIDTKSTELGFEPPDSRSSNHLWFDTISFFPWTLETVSILLRTTKKREKAATIKFPSEQKSPESFREHYVEENMTATKLIGLFRSKVRIQRTQSSATPFSNQEM